MTEVENSARIEALKSDRKFINKAFWAYNWSIPMNFTRERMLGCSMTAMVCRVADDIYPGDAAKQKELAKNHAVFFNTQQGLGAVIYGAVLGMEIERAENDEIPNTLIQSVKQALAGPLAGLGDSLIQALLTPIIISIAIGMSQESGSI
ncbi:MAG: PTS system mannose/fructose/sorbose family transporter subunit IID, partial [Erysipelotrichia bacterium]|nr:PTS system mannose/fructose/sorbose family transporter subunit IID [Erysipelotrichia bacterium]